MPFPTVLEYADRFDRPDENPVAGGSWLPEMWNGRLIDPFFLQVVDGGLTCTDFPGASQHYNAVAGPNVESRVTYKAGGTGDEFRLLVRLQAGGTSLVDGFALHVIDNGVATLVIDRLDDGVYTELGSQASVHLINFGDEFAIDVENTVVYDAWADELEPAIAVRGYQWKADIGWTLIQDQFQVAYPEAGTAAIEISSFSQTLHLGDWRYGTKLIQQDLREYPKQKLKGGA